MPIFKPALSAVLFLFICAPMSAAADSLDFKEPCTLNNNYCVPFVACTENGQSFLWSVTFGRRDGTLRAKSQDGVVCTGEWRRTTTGAGKARFSCSDGLKGRSRYTYLDAATGVVLGRGRLSNGDRLRFWSGHNILPYVLEREQERVEMISCVSRAVKRQLQSGGQHEDDVSTQ